MGGGQALAQGGRPSLRGGRFLEGVLSGDPGPRGITLWTRVADAERAGTVELEVARDRGFRRVVSRELVPTSNRSAHSVKARVDGLRPHEEYWYRFSTRGEESPVGRFRTAPPPDSREPVRFAFFSCQDYGFGYFNAHALMAGEDIDFVVNLGDYIYAEADYTTATGTGVRTDPVGLSETLEQYRAKYGVYRSDPRLRRMHSRFPMVSIWDDHEVQNNYAGGAGPSGGRWAVDADFDHHGYGLVTANQRSLACTLRRIDTVKRPSRKALPDRRFSYRISRGQPSLLD